MIKRFDTVLGLLENTFENYTSEPAFTCLGCTLNFTEVDELSNRFASYLRVDLGLNEGDRLAIQLPNVLQYPVAIFGAVKAGIVIVNTNPLYTARELKYQLKDSGAKALLVLANVAHTAADIIDETDVEHVIVTELADLHPAPKRQIVNFVVKHLKKLVPAFHFKNVIPFRETVKNEARHFTPPIIDKDTLFALQYTGGTTGVSKGTMLTHNNVASNVWQLINLLPEAFELAEETFAACLPLYHIYALNIHGLSSFSRGAHNVLIPNPRDLNSLIAAIKSVQVSVFVGINTLFVALCHHKDIGSVDFSRLKITCAGGMALTEDAANAWKALTGIEVYEGYGLTETSPVLAGNPLNRNKRGSVGEVLIETEVKVIDVDGNTLPKGEVGELCVRGPQVMKGYWNKPLETTEVLSDDGWLKTGDIAQIIEDDFLKIVDRKKDMINVSGFNVYPNEIEGVVSQHAKVMEVAAIGVADEKTGEAVKLFIVKDDESLTEEEIRDYCRENLTGYKNPKQIEFRECLPKTNVGKVLRRELRTA